MEGIISTIEGRSELNPLHRILCIEGAQEPEDAISQGPDPQEGLGQIHPKTPLNIGTELCVEGL